MTEKALCIQIDRQANCFNLVRLLAAIQVFVGHARVHLDVEFPAFLLNIIKGFGGVPIFFGLSGFLIWNSLNKTPNLIQYAKKRVLRLYPELWIGVLFNALVIIVLYFAKIKWKQFCLFLFAQASILQFWTPDFLREYGCGTPNGSLWTIGVMVQAYLFMWVIYKILHKTKMSKWIVFYLVFVALNILRQFLPNLLPGILSKLFSQTFAPYMWMFLLGAFFSEYFDCVLPALKKYWWIFFILSQAILYTNIDFGGYPTIHCTLLICSIIGFGYHVSNVKIKYDLSYGFYIYHMIVINAMIQLGFVGHWSHIVVAFIISILLAGVSYFTIGSFSRKKRNAMV